MENKNNLLITTIGNYYQNAFEWCSEKEKRNYDVCLINYLPKNQQLINWILLSKYYAESEGFKFELIFNLLNQNKQLMKYSYYYMPDEDVNLSVENINKLFEIMKKYKLNIGQPSLIGNDIDDSPMPNVKLRLCDYVNLTNPAFSNSALEKCLWSFDISKSGWGLDYLWAEILQNKKMAIIDEITGTITRKMAEGNLYQKLSEKNVNWHKDSNDIMEKYGIKNKDGKRKIFKTIFL